MEGGGSSGPSPLVMEQKLILNPYDVIPGLAPPKRIRGEENTDRVIVEQINRRLHADYGRTLDGRPIWRIVFSSEQFELKRGVHEEYSPSGNLFIRSWVGVKKCLKYSYLMDKWILERLTFGVSKVPGIAVELVEAKNGSYEPAWVFMDKDGNPLPVNFRICEALFARLAAGPQYSSPTAREQLRQEFEDKEVLELEEYFGEIGRSPMFATEIPAVSYSGPKLAAKGVK